LSGAGSPFIEMKSIEKVYPDGTVALKGVDLTVRRGEIVGLLGENGAGKTTLMKILSGLLQSTGGTIFVNGKPVKFKNPMDALKLGIGMVHQHFTLVPLFSPTENIVLGQEGGGSLSTLLPLKMEEAEGRIKDLMEKTGLKVPLGVPVESLSLGAQQRIEILKVLYRGANCLILDEPTSFLTPLEVKELFQIMLNLKNEGRSVIFITHKLREVLEASDRIVVLRGGMVAGEVTTSAATPQSLAVMMVGKELPQPVVERKPSGGLVLMVKDLQVRNDLEVMAVKGVSFEVKAGEILGIAGVEGNGQAELVEALTGLRRVEAGSIMLDGVEVSNSGPLNLFKSGLVHIPADRHRHGLVLEFSLSENSIIGRQWEPDFLSGFSRLNMNKVREFTDRIIRQFNVVAPGPDSPAKSLSGGNQQRLIVGRELTKKNVKLIVAAHPTRGLDIASTLYMHNLLVRMREEGKGVILVSADLDEIVQLADRVAVMYEGQILRVGRTNEISREEIGMLMGGIRAKQ